jgi:hypothetical protein
MVIRRRSKKNVAAIPAFLYYNGIEVDQRADFFDERL